MEIKCEAGLRNADACGVRRPLRAEIQRSIHLIGAAVTTKEHASDQGAILKEKERHEGDENDSEDVDGRSGHGFDQ